MKIGPYTLKNNLILSPMAGITDRPFRQICRDLGAGLAVSEMTASNPNLRHHRRTLLKLDHSGEDEPRSVQIVGTNPEQMAEAALFNQSTVHKSSTSIWAALPKKYAMSPQVPRY